jgi:hypothetical protein
LRPFEAIDAPNGVTRVVYYVTTFDPTITAAFCRAVALVTDPDGRFAAGRRGLIPVPMRPAVASHGRC